MPKYPPPDYFTIDISGFPLMVNPADNRLSRQGVALGRRLFYDPILSGDSTQACADCHDPAFSFGDPRRFSIGIDGIEGDRQAPALINTGFLREAFWDGRAATIEDQALGPVANPIEMNLAWPEASKRLNAHPTYPEMFGRVFGTEVINRTHIVRAIAQFERTLVSNNTRYEKWLRGEASLTAEEDSGRVLFFNERGDCFHCHGQELNTDRAFHNIGLDSIIVDTGLGNVTGNTFDIGLFKTPTLRNIALTAPYMHDGRFATLEEVLAHYNQGFFLQPNLDPLISLRLGTPQNPRPPLTALEVQQIIAFLQTLTDDTFMNEPDFKNPFQPAP